MPFGFGVWCSFLYVGVRTRHRGWLLSAALYLVLLLSAFAFNATGLDSAGNEDPTMSAIAAALLLLTWIAGAVHARVIHDSVRDRMTLAKEQGRHPGRQHGPPAMR